MGIDIFKKIGIFPSEAVRASFHANLQEDRSESSIAVNPQNSANLIGVSKLFTDIHKYKFTVAAVFSQDGGLSWQNAAPLKLLPGWEGLSDPSVFFDANGVAYIVTEPLNFNYASDPDHNPAISSDIVATHMVIYKSTNGGASWADPVIIDTNDNNEDRFDKPWSTINRNNGVMYATWGYSNLQFARSLNGGANWKGLGNQSINTLLGGGSAPEINTDASGNIHIVSHNQTTNYISYLRSKDGGLTLEAEKKIAVGLKDIDSGISGSGFKHFPNATFRVLTLATACCLPTNQNVAVAWADTREGVTRIYYTISDNSGDSWPANSGIPLLPAFSTSEVFHDFHPQIVSTGSGIIGCAFYRYYESSALIDVMFTGSFDGGQSFWFPEKLNSAPWNPAVNAPWSHGNSSITFIGDYFGLDADKDTFYVLWTNTKDGAQELYFNSVATSKYDMPDIFKGIFAQVFGGVAQDGGGFIIVNGKIIRVPPRSPMLDVLHAIAALDSVKSMGSINTRSLQKNLVQTIADIAEKNAGYIH